MNVAGRLTLTVSFLRNQKQIRSSKGFLLFLNHAKKQPLLRTASFATDTNTTTGTQSFPFSPYRTSGRRHKRLQRKRRMRQQAKESQQPVAEEEEEEDTRTWRTILFPPLYGPNEPRPPSTPWPKNPMVWYTVNKEAWALYKESWEGFFSNHSSSKSGDSNSSGEERNNLPTAEEVKQNVEQNLKVSRAEGDKLKKEFQERTGIHSLEDAKAMAREIMIVATEMMTEFMKEYRKGRDDEIEKMMNQYFQELQEKDKKGKQAEEAEERPQKLRRKVKRRIPGLIH